VFAALADPTRRAMLDRLRSGEATLNQLALPFEMSVQGVQVSRRSSSGASSMCREALKDSGADSRRARAREELGGRNLLKYRIYRRRTGEA
jgi:DNA-binding transcriptional ArsR family regulator